MCAGAPGGAEVEAGGELAGEGAGVLQGEDAAGHGVGHALLPALREGLVDGGAVAVGAAEGCDTGRTVIRTCEDLLTEEGVGADFAEPGFPCSGRRRRPR